MCGDVSLLWRLYTNNPRAVYTLNIHIKLSSYYFDWLLYLSSFIYGGGGNGGDCLKNRAEIRNNKAACQIAVIHPNLVA